MAKQITWCGTVKEKDDFGDVIKDVFIDGATAGISAWAIMTPNSHSLYGAGLGLGFGQKYVKQANGDWLKVEG